MQRFFENEWDWKWLDVTTNKQLQKQAERLESEYASYPESYRLIVMIRKIKTMSKSTIQHLNTKTNYFVWYEISRHPTLSLQLIIDNPTLPWNWYVIKTHKFRNDKIWYVESKLQTILLFTVMESCERRKPHILGEYIFADWHIINSIKHFL